MIFLVSAALFDYDKTRSVDLLTLLRIAARRTHALFVVDNPHTPSLLEPEMFRKWRTGLGEPIGTEVDLLVEQLRTISSNVSARGSFVVTVTAPKAEQPSSLDSHFRTDLEGAIRVAGLPLYVLLENGLSDAAFLRRVMPKSWAARLAEWESIGVIQFENGGGVTEMIRMVEHYSTGKAPDPSGVGQLAWRASHLLVSDRDSHPDGSESANCKQLRKVCTKSGMGHRLYVLRRRDQESYLPRQAIDKMVEAKTDPNDRQAMTQLLDVHFADAFGRLHNALPKLGEQSWFKNAFVKSDIAWESSWFEQDGSKDEMVELAELVASLI